MTVLVSERSHEAYLLLHNVTNPSLAANGHVSICKGAVEPPHHREDMRWFAHG